MELQLCLSLQTLPITGCCSSSTSTTTTTYLTPPITTTNSGCGGVDDYLLHSVLDLNFTAISCTTSVSSTSSSSSSSSPRDNRSDGSSSDDLINRVDLKRKRDSSGSTESRTLPLLNWNNQPDDHHHRRVRNSPIFAANNVRNEGSDVVVGWPPIKSYRRNEFGYHHNHRATNYFPVKNDNNDIHTMNSRYVKAQIEGILITRKIDLCQYSSYQGLVSSLLTLFGRGLEYAEERYNLAYLDNEGDWLLAGDVPWREFVQSVHRLKLLRNLSS